MRQILLLLKYLPFLQNLLRPLFTVKGASLEREFYGSKYRNPIGISAGVDRQGEFYNELSTFGPSFVEIGPVKKVENILKNLRNNPKKVFLTVNLTSRQSVTEDINLVEMDRACSLLYDFADALTITVPRNGYENLIDRVLTIRQYNDHFKPVAVKITNILEMDDVEPIVRYALQNGVDAIEVGDNYFDKVFGIAGGIVPVIVISYLKEKGMAASFLEKGASFIAYAPEKSLRGLLSIKKIIKSIVRQ